MLTITIYYYFSGDTQSIQVEKVIENQIGVTAILPGGREMLIPSGMAMVKIIKNNI